MASLTAHVEPKLIRSKFLHVNNVRTPRPSRPPSPVLKDKDARAASGADQRRQRSMSVSDLAKDAIFEMSERMKHTRDFKNKGFKGNSRGNFIQAPFTTLEEMFKKLPETIGFNIEMSESRPSYILCLKANWDRISNATRE